MRDEWEGHGNGSFGSFPPYPPLPCRFGTVSMSLSALFSSLRSSEPSAVRPEGPPETNGMRRGKGVRKETTEVTEDEELTTLGILSAHFARRYHFICLGLTARSSLFPSHSSSTPLGSPPRSGRPSAGPEESGDGVGYGWGRVTMARG